ncbi:hypothetical protein Pla163_06150 [Planctomycetes bacterium Pla163]|uniref:Peptidase M12B domain-containing protein n=1 Tax=Rohdeia mirabilis TaxID=2528008 RepID=A0A518CWB2_9BACT|nr:hypothetical protein Pla163_06150 [Planctomycetes bacterium Pla163]
MSTNLARRVAGALLAPVALSAFALAAPASDLGGRDTAIFPLVPDLERHMTIDGELLEWLSESSSVLLVETQLPGELEAAFELERVRLPDDRGGLLRVDGEVVGTIASQRSADLSLWRGRVAGRANTDVFMAFSSAGTWGWVRLDNGRTVHLQCGPHPDLGWERTQVAWVEDARLRRPGFEQRFACGARPADGREITGPFVRTDLGHVEKPVGEGDGGAGTGGGSLEGGQGHSGGAVESLGGDGATGGAGGSSALVFGPAPAPAPAAMLQQTLYIAEAVIETDYAYYLEFNNLTVATNYATVLIGACSDKYEQQVGCLWDLASLALYTSGSTDPFSGNSPNSLLAEMKSYWSGSGGLHNLGDFGLVLSGWGGGGVAYLDEVCDNSWGVGSCCSINGNANFPVTGQSSLNWDFVVTTHEAGHIFDAVHTHQFCPPVDHCDANCDGFETCTVGSIMSYCHTCTFAGISNIDPNFHPANVTRIRNTVTSKSCLDVYTPPITEPIVATVSPDTVLALEPDAWPVITFTGQNFASVTGVRVDGVDLVTPFDYQIVDDTTLKVNWRPVSKLGQVTVRITNPGGVTTSFVQVDPRQTPALDMKPSDPSFWVQTAGLDVYMSGRPRDLIWLVLSTTEQPTVLPGLVSLDIGNSLLDYIDLGIHTVSPTKGWVRWGLPFGYNPGLSSGTRLLVQGVVIPFDGVTFPLGTTQVQGLTVLF